MYTTNSYISAILTASLVIIVSGSLSTVYGENCDINHDKCAGKDSSHTTNENVCAPLKDNKNSDDGSSNVKVQNADQKCSDGPLDANRPLLGGGPYSFPTDTFTLPT
ncbi:MAG: hypothetical protein ABJB85_09270 [Nitrososphaerota archaeon]